MADIVALSLGAQASTMAWSIKRLVSSFNRIITRPHRPRSDIIRNIMVEAGIPVPAATGPDETDCDDDGDGFEEGEEEAMVEDEAVEPGPAPIIVSQKPLADAPAGEAVAGEATAPEPKAGVLSIAPACKKLKKAVEEGGEQLASPEPVPLKPPEPLPPKDVEPPVVEDKGPAPDAPSLEVGAKRELQPTAERPLKRLKNLLAARTAELKALKAKLGQGLWARNTMYYSS